MAQSFSGTKDSVTVGDTLLCIIWGGGGALSFCHYYSWGQYSSVIFGVTIISAVLYLGALGSTACAVLRVAAG